MGDLYLNIQGVSFVIFLGLAAVIIWWYNPWRLSCWVIS